MCSTGATTPQREGMFDVQNIYGTPQVPRKKPCMRPRRMTLIDLRNVPLSQDETPQRKASSGTVRSEGGLSQYSKSGIWHIHDSTDSLPSSHRGSMRSKHASESSQESIRFPKLEDCAHFHYDFVDFGQLQVNLCDDDRENFRHNDSEPGEVALLARVSCSDKSWTIRRTLVHFSSLDRQLHRCIFDRKFSQLPDLQTPSTEVKSSQEMEQLLQNYLKRFSELAGTMINCGSILNWLEMDNRGNRLLAVDDSGINTPAIAAAHAVKRYNAQAADEISLQVGDIVSVIDMPPVEDTIWWRGKRGFEVGFFPSACVEVIIGDKVPSSMATVMPVTGSLSSSIHGATLTPLSTPAVTRKPCEVDEETASMIRKHGKLMSVLRTFFTNRPPRNQLKQSGIVKERVFGCDLGEHLLNSGHDVPVVLKSCAEVIERYGIVDGIYRLSGITSNIQKLRVAFDEDEVPELFEATYLQDIHSISSLLKMYFRELPNPLLTYQLYDKFAEAVRDEDNKLLRIHDVVQQLPPPHYRTLEYLMRHLGRVASHAFETGMHSKNLAIVWAPNLLRSKELELGGGAAALQGVGIQAVVTECLICYCDLIFNDRMPPYNSPHLHKSQKKPRPKSLAISTPTRLLTLEEARERAFLTSLAHSQRFIDVGGGPSSLPPNYHTVIDLPGFKKKPGKPSNKGKKSPVSGGWKSIFSKPRAGSIKKPRKGSMQGDEKPLESLQAKALTEEDVHNWKHRLRGAKSAESLLSMATSARSSICSQSSSSVGLTEGGRHRDELLAPYHKRSLSSDASAILQPRYHTSPHLELPSPVSPGQVALVSMVPSGSSHPPRGGHPRQPDPSYKPSFVRGDSSRKPLHRRTPSAPSTPRQDRHLYGTSASAHSSPSKASSQPQLDSLSGSGSPNSDSSLLTPPSDSSLGIDIDAAIKARLQQMAMQYRGARSPEKVPAESNSGRAEVEKKVEGRNGVVEFPPHSSPPTTTSTSTAPPNSNKKNPERAKFFVSRYHDYAEIVSDGDDDDDREEEERSPTTDMGEVMEKWDRKLSSTSPHYLPPPSSSSDHEEPEPKHAKLDREKGDAEKAVVRRRREKVCSNNTSSDCSPPSTQVVRRRVEIIPSDGCSAPPPDPRNAVQFPELTPLHSDSARPPIPQSRNHRGSQQQSGGGGGGGGPLAKNMSKCLSVPSDIAQSLENITASQTDLLSSMTLSELSQSINSFCTPTTNTPPTAATNDVPSLARDNPRWRRSTSLDSLEGESTMGRTLRVINAQIDTAFHQKVERAIQLEEEGYSRHGDSDSSSLTPLHISEDNLAAQGSGSELSPHHHDNRNEECLSETSTTVGGPLHDPLRQTYGQEAFPRSVSDSRNLGSDNPEPSMSQSYPAPASHHHPRNQPPELPGVKGDNSNFNAHPEYPDYAIIRKRQKTSKEDRGPGFYQGVLEDTLPDGASPVSGGGASPSNLQSFVGGGNSAPDYLWPQGGEGYAVSPQVVPASPHRGAANSRGRQNVLDPLWQSRVQGSDSGMQNPEVVGPNMGGSRFNAGDVHHRNPLPQSELSSAVCVVKRQEKSSSSSCSSSSSSDDDDENLENSMEVLHRLEPIGAQFAVKLSRKQQKNAGMSPSQKNSPVTNPASSLRIVERTSSSAPENKMQDIHWKQSPLFGDGGESGVGGGGGRLNRHPNQSTKSPQIDRRRTEAFNSVRPDGSYEFSEESSRTFPPHVHSSGEGYASRQGGGGGGRGVQGGGEGLARRLSQSEHNREAPASSLRPGERPRAASQSDSALKFQREELPIISGNLPASPQSQRSHLPSPVCSPPPPPPSSSQQSRLPSPRSPVTSNPATSGSSPATTVSSPPAHRSRLPSLHSPNQPPASKMVHSPPLPPSPSHHHHHHHHHPPLPPSPTHLPPSSSGDQSELAAPPPSMPLHLMLYHPDEFQIPPAAVGVTSEMSLPQVYVKSDTVTEEKAVIRKTGGGKAEGLQGGSTAQNWSPGKPGSLSSPGRNSSLSSLESGGAASSHTPMQLVKAEQDSMEVDNLCNRLVDELHSMRTQQPPTSEPQQGAGAPRGGVQVEAVVERRVEETEVGGEAISEERLLRVESFGEVQEEEMENALNAGKELLLSHSSSLTPTPPSSTTTTTTTILSTPPQPPSKATHERRPSASKIPRFHKRTDSREEKTGAASEEDGTPTSHLHRRTSSQEERVGLDACGAGETTPSPRVQRQSGSREEKSVVVGETTQSLRVQKQSSSSREEKSTVCETATQSPRVHKQSREERTVSDVTQGKGSQYSRYHRQSSSREERTVVTDTSPGNRAHRRTGSQEERTVAGGDNHDVSPHPRAQRRANSRDEKNASSEPSVENTSSRTSGPNRSRASDRTKAGSNSKSKEANDYNRTSSARMSKIPLSQKLPSPTTSTREAKMSKAVTSPSSPRQAAAPPTGKSQNQRTQPSPVPRTRMSVAKSENAAPPSEEVMEVSRPSVKKRTPAAHKGKMLSSAKESKSEKNVIVQELKMEKGDAKLVIEKQPNLKKKIQTVHAQKVPHPARQIAEALDTDTCDTSPAELSSATDLEHSGMSSQEDEVFSDENLCLRVGRDRSFSSGMGMDSPRSARQPLFLSPLLNQKSESYHHMAASRSSLDDSALQLAAERQDDLLVSLENTGRGGGYYTGSLRSRRSQKMRNLMEMFERGGASSHSSEESGDTKKMDRSGSTSGSTTLSAASQEKGLEGDDDDDLFQPPCSPLPLFSNPSRRSRSRERGGGGGGGGGAGRVPSPHKHPSQSPSRRLVAARGEELRRRRPSPANRGGGNSEDKPRGVTTHRSESGVGFGRPPRYRSTSRGRVYSDSSTSESDNTQLDSKRTVFDFSATRPRGGLPKGPSALQEDTTSSSGEKSQGSSCESVGDNDDGSQRRGSIKELRQLFEKSPKDESRDSGNELSPPVPPRRFVRTRSMSPAAESSASPVTPSIMRRSMEIPPSSTMVKQPLRLGPKPFYGSKK